jgi:LPXTG-motif cell wall-anchored protein
MKIYAEAVERPLDFHGWSIESDNPDVFRIIGECTPERLLICDAQAIGEGRATLSVRNKHGQRMAREEVEVLVPDRAVLEAAGYLFLHRDKEAPIDDLRILAKGTATYHVRYFRQGRELRGNGVLSVVAPSGVTATVQPTFDQENREWLALTPDATTSCRSIELFADGVSIGTRSLVTVPETDIDHVVIEKLTERDRVDNEPMMVLAQAYDRQGRRIFGVDFKWNLDGVEQSGSGDLFRYDFKKGELRRLTAHRGNRSDSIDIQAEGGKVDSTNPDTGCSAGGSASLLTGLALAGLVAFRRRRRR